MACRSSFSTLFKIISIQGGVCLALSMRVGTAGQGWKCMRQMASHSSPIECMTSKAELRHMWTSSSWMSLMAMISYPTNSPRLVRGNLPDKNDELACSGGSQSLFAFLLSRHIPLSDADMVL